MPHRLNQFMPRGAAPRAATPHRAATTHPSTHPAAHNRAIAERKPTYTKIFRWQLPAGGATPPKSVEVIGSFTNWEAVPLHRDANLNTWQVTVHHIEGNRTHHYMLLVDGHPTQDKNSDGLAVAHGPQELNYALNTSRGPRLFMLFAQTK
jgi:hypothetical protein